MDAEITKEFIKEALRLNYLVFIDTCSLLEESSKNLLYLISPILLGSHRTIIVPMKVWSELDKKFDDAKRDGNIDLLKRVDKAMHLVKDLSEKGVVEILGDESDSYLADNVFVTQFTRLRLKHNLLLITQDNNLSKDIINLENSKSSLSRYKIIVARINRYGTLNYFENSNRLSLSTQQNVHKNEHADIDIPIDGRFGLATKVAEVTGSPTVTYIPKVSDEVFAVRDNEKVSLRLTEEGPSGGEGTIYKTSILGLVAKIYRKEKITNSKYEKLKLMMSRYIDCEGICYPIAILYNTYDEFVGFLMKEARGTELQKCVFMPHLKIKFPTWNKIQTVQLCITILKKIKYLHDRNVIIGDINPLNILVVSPTEVYFVDTDSYQVEGFPCPVGTINFTASEIQSKEFSKFLRTIGNERFAVATLMFMIMLPGKPPYSLQGGESQVDNIINGDFAYPFGEKSTGKVPAGLWRFCWSHLPFFLKRDFYETFRKGECHYAEDTRLSTGDWIRDFENYLGLLTSGKLVEQDEQSIEIFPTRLKKNINIKYARCRICGQEFPEDQLEEGICRKCLYDGEKYSCRRCGSEMTYTNYRKYVKKRPRHLYCRACNDHLNMIYENYRCIQCGRMFSLTYREKESFEEKGLALPRRCPECRRLRKAGILE